MLKILQATISIALISTVLAGIISLAEKLLNNYGRCKIEINDGARVLEVEGGSSLLAALSNQKIFIPSACGGKATCGLCKLRITEGAGPLLPTEEPYLSAQERAQDYRLSCQIKVKNDLRIYVAEELFNIKEYIAKVELIRDLTHDIKLLRLRLPEGESIKFKAGQFVQFYTKPYGKVKEEVFRAYSIASKPSDQNQIELMIRKVPDGIATGYVHTALKEGDTVRLSGPYGDFYRRGGEGVKELIMLAGGSGMAPIASLIRDITEQQLDYKIRYFFGASTLRDMFYLEEMAALEKENPNFEFIPALSRYQEGDDWDGRIGNVIEVMKQEVSDGEAKEAYLCGSPGMLNATVKALHELGFKDQAIFYDKF
ncbi:MAG: 2Fe-2S iron-sulfur cluster binding domain-containing protein [Eubacteriales bacterium]|nr:2Fe-2S iron-sulfur cluster binding domain-containing protein [Eubacteriales bacterium]